MDTWMALSSSFTYFQYDNRYYKQVLDASMGGCTSPLFADLAMELFENHSLTTLLSKRQEKSILFSTIGRQQIKWQKYFFDQGIFTHNNYPI